MRIRSIKPETLSDEKAAALSDTAWRLWVSSWLLADDSGNLRAEPRYIAGQVFWARPDIKIEVFIQELSGVGLWRLYNVRGQRYAHVTGWKHQKIDHPSKPLCPAPEDEVSGVSRSPLDASSRDVLATVSRDSRDSLAPDQDHDLDRDQYQDQDRDHDTTLAKVADTVASVPDVVVFESLCAAQGWGIQLRGTERKRCHDLVPIQASEVVYALGEVARVNPRRPAAFFLGVVEGQREDAKRPRPKRRREEGWVKGTREMMADIERAEAKALPDGKSQ